MKLSKFSIITLIVSAMLSGCNDQQASQSDPKEPIVEVITLIPRKLTLWSELPGRVEPIRVAEVRARVPGIILNRFFEEGSDVKAGQVLFQIDPAPLQVALTRAQAQLASSDAALTEAQSLARRYKSLANVSAVSKQEFESIQARLKTAKAAKQSALADVEAARLNLEYASVKAPISGHIGRAQVTEGALVGQDSATPLALIQQLNPIYVDFQQPAIDALRLRAALSNGQLTKGDENAGSLSLHLDGSDQKRNGQLLFSDISVDRDTGQMTLRGKFENNDGYLYPGMYVRVTTELGEHTNALLVPQRAVQRSKTGSANVLIVNAQNIVQERKITTGNMEGKLWHVTSGLASGDRVIVSRLNSVQVGDKVKIQEIHANSTTQDNGK